MDLDLRQMVMALARALDLVGVDDVGHGQRVAYMAVECARWLGWSEGDQDCLLNASLLHDCGVSSTRSHQGIAGAFDPSDTWAHCRRGAGILEGFGPLAHLAPMVLHHHTCWQELPGQGVAPALGRFANLIHLADRADALAIPWHRSGMILHHMGGLRKRMAEGRGSHFSPEGLEAFLALSRAEAFWLSQSQEYLDQTVTELAGAGPALPAGPGDVQRFALAMAGIVDAKSPFTAQHSLGVARVALALAALAGLAPEQGRRLEVAALLHDVGKLSIPDEILEYPSKLSDEDRSTMRRHSFATYQILRRIGGLEELALWAALHHESLSSDGYPFRLGPERLPLEARILKVADVYQAMAQTRPYRGPWRPDQILGLLREMVASAELDPALVDLVAGNLELCHRAAVGAAA